MKNLHWSLEGDFLILCVCECALTMCGGQRAACRSDFSPSTMRASEFEHGLSGLVAKPGALQAILLAQTIGF